MSDVDKDNVSEAIQSMVGIAAVHPQYRDLAAKIIAILHKHQVEIQALREQVPKWVSVADKPMSEREDDELFAAGIWVTNNVSVSMVWEIYIGSIDEYGKFIDQCGDEISEWELSDFTHTTDMPEYPLPPAHEEVK